jgi:acetylornithine deacetylase
MSVTATQMDATLEVLERLIQFDTVSAKSNLPLLEHVQSFLNDHDISSQLVFNAERNKANLYCTIGRVDIGGVLLSGHTDVVPVEGQRWSTDPFRMVRRGSRIHGRGAADMKGWLAAVLVRVPQLKDADLRVPVHLALSHDEEVGCVGVRSLIDILARAEVRPAMCIVGEPTAMQVVIAHKGKQYIRAHVHGLETHSSLSPFGVNAVEVAAELITRLRDLGMLKQQDGPFDREFDVPYTTVMTGIVHGGTNLNIVPNECWFDFEVREIPGDDPFVLIGELKRYAEQTLLPRMRAVSLHARIEFEEVSLRSSLDTAADAEIVRLTKEWTGRADHGKVAFGTEAALFQRMAGIPSVVCGPGSIQQAHKPDEYVEIEQLHLFHRFLDRLIDWAQRPARSPDDDASGLDESTRAGRSIARPSL